MPTATRKRTTKQQKTEEKPEETPAAPTPAPAPVPATPIDRETFNPAWNVLQRLSAAIKHCGAIEKSGKNQQQGYLFIEQARIVAEIKNILPDFGLLLKTETTDCEIRPEQTKNGSAQDCAFMKCRYSFINIDNPSDREIWEAWPSIARDTSDKAVNKASTANMKYFLIRQFMISDKDPDSDSPETGHAHGGEQEPINQRQKVQRYKTQQGQLPQRPQNQDTAPQVEDRVPEYPPEGDWREYVIQCGKTARGRKVGSFNLASLRELCRAIETTAQNRELSEEEARTLRYVKIGISELEAPLGTTKQDQGSTAPAPATKPAGDPREILTAKIENALCREDYFIDLLHRNRLLVPEVTLISQMSDETAQSLIDDWRLICDAMDEDEKGR